MRSSRYGVQFASSRAYVSCPPYAELERLLGATVRRAAGRRADDHARALRGAADPGRQARTPWSATRWFTTACRPCCRRWRPRARPAASSDTTGWIGWTSWWAPWRPTPPPRLVPRRRRLQHARRRCAPGPAARAGVASRPALDVHRRRPRRQLVGPARARHGPGKQRGAAAHGHGGVAGQGVLGGRRGHRVARRGDGPPRPHLRQHADLLGARCSRRCSAPAIASARVHLSPRDPRTPAPAQGPDLAVQRPGGRARPAARITAT